MRHHEPCSLCGAPSLQLWNGERATYRCEAGSGSGTGEEPGCGVVWTVPPTHDTAPDERFTDDYYKRHYEPRAAGMVRDFARHLEWVEQHLSEIGFRREARGNHWLDVGCGGGYFARAALDRGWEVTGIDPAPAAVERARRMAPEGRYSCSAASELPEPSGREGGDAGEAGDVSDDTDRFSVVSFWDSLFVVPDPNRELAALQRRLIDGGVLVVKSMHRPPQFFQAAHGLLGWRPATRDDYAGVRHARWHFTPDSASALLRRHGLEPVARAFTGEVPNPDEDSETGLRALLGKAVHHTLHRTHGPESFLLMARKPVRTATAWEPMRRAA